MKLHKFNRDLPDHRALVQFRNMDKPCMVITVDKAKGDAKNFREAAGLIDRSTERGKMISVWLGEMAGKFEKLEP